MLTTRAFLGSASQAAAELHTLIPSLAPEHIPELSAYLTESWGNRTRVDYGSGMELNFICWLSVALRHSVTTPSHTKQRADLASWLDRQIDSAQTGCHHRR